MIDELKAIKSAFMRHEMPLPFQSLTNFVLKQKQQLGGRFDDSGLTECLIQLPGMNIVSIMGLHMSLPHHTPPLRMDLLNEQSEQR